MEAEAAVLLLHLIIWALITYFRNSEVGLFALCVFIAVVLSSLDRLDASGVFPGGIFLVNYVSIPLLSTMLLATVMIVMRLHSAFMKARQLRSVMRNKKKH